MLGGAWLLQMSMTYGQRGWNRQPLGGASRLGGAPRPLRCGDDVRLGSGAALISNCVYGWAGESVSCALGADSTSWPAYITEMVSARYRADAMSWVTYRMARPSSLRRSASRLRTPRRMETSSIDTGSSAMRTRGRTARARAIETRWRWPPDSSCGDLAANRAGGFRATRFRSSFTDVSGSRATNR